MFFFVLFLFQNLKLIGSLSQKKLKKEMRKRENKLLHALYFKLNSQKKSQQKGVLHKKNNRSAGEICSKVLFF